MHKKLQNLTALKQKCFLMIETFTQPDVGSIPISIRWDGYFDECIAITDSDNRLDLSNPLRVFSTVIVKSYAFIFLVASISM